MPFVKIPGLSGKIYVPEEKTGRRRKHACRDCYACQMCGEDRCRLCRQTPCRSGKQSAPGATDPQGAAGRGRFFRA